MFLEALKREVWKKAKGNTSIAKASHHYEDIRKAILRDTAYRLSKDTIRNFLEDRHEPQPKVLDIYATFVLEGTQEKPKTIQEFEDWLLKQNEVEPKTQSAWPSRIRVLLASLVLLLVFIFGTIGSRFTDSEPADLAGVIKNDSSLEGPIMFHYPFQKPKLRRLYNDGWFWMGDSTDVNLWEAYNPVSNDYLRMPTLLGDSWSENRNYPPYIRNVLARSIDCGSCCEISVKIVGFNPYQRYQQAGLFLFNSKEEVPSLRYTFASNGGSNHIDAVLREGLYQNRHLIPGQIYGHRSRISWIKENSNGQHPQPDIQVDSIILQVTIDPPHYFFVYQINDNEPVPLASRKIEVLEPRFLGIAAFQGRPDIPYPSYPIADTIVASFEYVNLEPCK